jgi:hypothetical protein
MAIWKPKAIDAAPTRAEAQRRMAAGRLSCLARNGRSPGEESRPAALRHRRSRRSRSSVGSSHGRDRLGTRDLTAIHQGDSGDLGSAADFGGDRSNEHAFRPTPASHQRGRRKTKALTLYDRSLCVAVATASLRSPMRPCLDRAWIDPRTAAPSRSQETSNSATNYQVRRPCTQGGDLARAMPPLNRIEGCEGDDRPCADRVEDLTRFSGRRGASDICRNQPPHLW